MTIVSKDISKAVQILNNHDVVAIPTETVYGLAGNIYSEKAIRKIFEIKKRPLFNPLIVHVHSLEKVEELVLDFPEKAKKLAKAFWPGPLTLVLKKKAIIPDLITAGKDTVAIRIPNHPVTLSLLKELPFPLAAPSANRFGHVSPTNAAAVVEELGKYLTKEDLVLDGGACHVGVESTIIDCTGASPRILRPGAISELMIEECTGLPVLAGNLLTKGAEDIRVSGSLENHYAPAAKVFLNQSPVPGQGFIADSSIKTPEGVIRLASPNNDEEFARLLYSALRAADAKGLSEVVVIQPIGAGIAVAIRDRLARAARGR